MLEKKSKHVKFLNIFGRKLKLLNGSIVPLLDNCFRLVCFFLFLQIFFSLSLSMRSSLVLCAFAEFLSSYSVAQSILIPLQLYIVEITEFLMNILQTISMAYRNCSRNGRQTEFSSIYPSIHSYLFSSLSPFLLPSISLHSIENFI